MIPKKTKIKLLDFETKEVLKVNGYLLELDLYNVEIEFVFGQWKEVRRFYNENVSGFVHKSEGGSYLLYSKNRTAHNTVIHELYHLVNFISKTRGLSDDETNEQQAYLIGWLFDLIQKMK